MGFNCFFVFLSGENDKRCARERVFGRSINVPGPNTVRGGVARVLRPPLTRYGLRRGVGAVRLVARSTSSLSSLSSL